MTPALSPRPPQPTNLAHKLIAALDGKRGRQERADAALPIVLEALDRAWDYVSLVHRQTTTPATQERAALIESDIRAIRRTLTSWRF